MQTLIISPLKNKEMLSLVEYAKKENIKVGILKDAYSQKIAKAFDNRNLCVIDNEQQILDYFQNSK
ncbi:MAG: hypothetical protein MJ223_03880 [Mycoplasmoidaceae bacterium]|nr:hypothetical protein [Mycoplasmoidaceae bacterium]